jgi:DNA invertase Pin-like site-specific DNA recombinase
VVSNVPSTSTPAVRRRDQTPSELAAFAEAERDRIRERIGQVKADQKARGRYLLAGEFPSGSGAAATASSSRMRPNRIIALRAQGRPLRTIAAVRIRHEGVAGVLKAAGAADQQTVAERV